MQINPIILTVLIFLCNIDILRSINYQSTGGITLEFLYKFTGPKYDKKSGRFNSFHILSKNQLWFCPASKQDNPDDLCLELDEFAIAKNTYQKVKEQYNPDLSFEEFLSTWIFQRRHAFSGIADTRDKFLICSFTSVPLPYMWKKYAANGTGFCCVYSYEKLRQYLDKNGIAMHDVRYMDYPIYRSFSEDEIEQNALPFCFIKSPHYQNEHEIRAAVFAKRYSNEYGQSYPAIPPIQIYYTQYIDPALFKLLNIYCNKENIPLVKVDYKLTPNA